jgi:hypothetical protein
LPAFLPKEERFFRPVCPACPDDRAGRAGVAYAWVITIPASAIVAALAYGAVMLLR